MKINLSSLYVVGDKITLCKDQWHYWMLLQDYFYIWGIMLSTFLQYFPSKCFYSTVFQGAQMPLSPFWHLTTTKICKPMPLDTLWLIFSIQMKEEMNPLKTMNLHLSGFFCMCVLLYLHSFCKRPKYAGGQFGKRARLTWGLQILLPLNRLSSRILAVGDF